MNLWLSCHESHGKILVGLHIFHVTMSYVKLFSLKQFIYLLHCEVLIFFYSFVIFLVFLNFVTNKSVHEMNSICVCPACFKLILPPQAFDSRVLVAVTPDVPAANPILQSMSL